MCSSSSLRRRACKGWEGHGGQRQRSMEARGWGGWESGCRACWRGAGGEEGECRGRGPREWHSAHTHTHAHTHIQTQTQTHARTRRRTCTHMQTHARTHTNPHAPTHRHIHTHARTDTPTRTHTHPHARTHTQTQTQTHAQTHADARTHTRRRTHAPRVASAPQRWRGGCGHGETPPGWQPSPAQQYGSTSVASRESGRESTTLPA
jgi:hypothetical protein